MIKSKTQIARKLKFFEEINRRASATSRYNEGFEIRTTNKTYTWSTDIEKIDIIRNGLPCDTIELLNKLTNISVKQFLNSLEIIQSTYTKKIKTKAFLSKRKSEFAMELVELFDYGLKVFNNEEKKFQRWLQKPNISLAKLSPDSFFDTITGITEVKRVLNRIEYGNMA